MLPLALANLNIPSEDVSTLSISADISFGCFKHDKSGGGLLTTWFCSPLYCLEIIFPVFKDVTWIFQDLLTTEVLFYHFVLVGFYNIAFCNNLKHQLGRHVQMYWSLINVLSARYLAALSFKLPASWHCWSHSARWEFAEAESSYIHCPNFGHMMSVTMLKVELEWWCSESDKGCTLSHSVCFVYIL